MRTEYAPFFRSTVGFDHLFDLLEQGSENAQGYPPYNIERADENNYRVTVAVAGFAEKDLNIEVRDGVLTVEGKRDPEQSTYLHQGIAARGFQRQFQLAEHMEVRGARLENGLLSVDLERIIPDEKKPRRIVINAPELKTIDGSRAA